MTRQGRRRGEGESSVQRKFTYLDLLVDKSEIWTKENM